MTYIKDNPLTDAGIYFLIEYMISIALQIKSMENNYSIDGANIIHYRFLSHS